MFEMLDRVERELVGMVDDLDPASLTPAEAATALERFAAIERRATAGRLLVAARAAESGVWKRHGHRSAAHWLAAQLGITVAKARRLLGVSKDLEKAPSTAGAVRKGQLSEDQANEVAPAAAAAPGHEHRLLGEAAKGDVAKLRDTCRQTKLAAAGDEAARRQRIRRGPIAAVVHRCRGRDQPPGPRSARGHGAAQGRPASLPRRPVPPSPRRGPA